MAKSKFHVGDVIADMSGNKYAIISMSSGAGELTLGTVAFDPTQYRALYSAYAELPEEEEEVDDYLYDIVEEERERVKRAHDADIVKHFRSTSKGPVVIKPYPEFTLWK